MIKAVKASNLTDLILKALQHQVVAIDEGQFFPDIVEVAEQLANAGIVVIIAALDGTFQRKPFGSILNLVPMAEFVTKLSAVCMDCGQEAAFSQRIIDSQ
jgi:thymidine kinase